MRNIITKTVVAMTLSVAFSGAIAHDVDKQTAKFVESPQQDSTVNLVPEKLQDYENKELYGWFERGMFTDEGFVVENYVFTNNQIGKNDYTYGKWVGESCPSDPCEKYVESGHVEYRGELESSSGNIIRKIYFITTTVGNDNVLTITQKTYNHDGVGNLVFGDNLGYNVEWDQYFIKH